MVYCSPIETMHVLVPRIIGRLLFTTSPALVDLVEGLVGRDKDGEVAGGHQLHHELAVVLLHQLVELVESVVLALLWK